MNTPILQILAALFNLSPYIITCIATIETVKEIIISYSDSFLLHAKFLM